MFLPATMAILALTVSVGAGWFRGNLAGHDVATSHPNRSGANRSIFLVDGTSGVAGSQVPENQSALTEIEREYFVYLLSYGTLAESVSFLVGVQDAHQQDVLVSLGIQRMAFDLPDPAVFKVFEDQTNTAIDKQREAQAIVESFFGRADSFVNALPDSKLQMRGLFEMLHTRNKYKGVELSPSARELGQRLKRAIEQSRVGWRGIPISFSAIFSVLVGILTAICRSAFEKSKDAFGTAVGK